MVPSLALESAHHCGKLLHDVDKVGQHWLHVHMILFFGKLMFDSIDVMI